MPVDVNLFPLSRSGPAQIAAWKYGAIQAGLLPTDFKFTRGSAGAPQPQADFMGWVYANQSFLAIGAATMAILLVLGGRR